jgi:4-amino-4-deoxy-L-arabinose transferase-like glycosyltransferase
MRGLAKFIRSDKFFYFVMAVMACVYIAGMYVDVMEIDAAQYAAMSMEMLQRGDWLHFYDRGSEYLDKPPLLFWLTGFSYQIFGFSNITYKLPSVLASALAVYSVYRIGALWYSKEAGKWAAVILASCEAFIVYNNDVRTDALLTGFVTFSLWHLSGYLKEKRWWNFVLGFIGIGLGMLAKGPIGLIVPVAAIGAHLILQRDWKVLFHWRWLLGFVIVLVALSPMLYGLYTQFDIHPEKTVNGQTGVSGLRFFFWTQSFGRVTGESRWDNDASVFYFFPTFMWMFLPWCVWFIWAFAKEVAALIKSRLRIEGNQEAVAVGGFVLIFIALSLSRYKLPHYIMVLMPLAALLLAKQLWMGNSEEKRERSEKVLGVIHPILLVMLASAATWLICVIFPIPQRQVLIAAAIIFIFAVMAWIYIRGPWGIVSSGALVAAAANLVVNTWFFPRLLEYQSGSQIGNEIVKENVPLERLRTFNLSSHALDFYTNRIVPEVFPPEHFKELRESGPVWVYTNEQGYERIKQAGVEAESIQSFDHYPVSNMKVKFLNAETRHETLERRYLIRY